MILFIKESKGPSAIDFILQTGLIRVGFGEIADDVFLRIERNVSVAEKTTIRIASIGASPRAPPSTAPLPIILSNQKVLKGKIMPAFIMSQLSLRGEQRIYF